MSGSQSRSARCVFVGNIPYDATEEQLIEIFQEVGPVVSFRLVFDRDTGKPKGYGFCEFRDQETALSAIRNLNNRDFNGRTLRVDFAETEKQQQQQQQQATQQAGARGGQALRRDHATPLPNQTGVPATPETIAAHVEGLNQVGLYDMVAKMKGVVQQNPDQARQLLLNNPTFAYALLQAQYLLGMINVHTVQKLVTKVAMVPPVPMAGVMGVPPPIIPPQPYPAAAGPFPIKQDQFQPQPIPQPYMAPPPQQQFPDSQLEQQKALLQQVISLTPEQIEALPLEQRQQVQQLRNTVLASYGQAWR